MSSVINLIQSNVNIKGKTIKKEKYTSFVIKISFQNKATKLSIEPPPPLKQSSCPACQNWLIGIALA